MDDLYVPKHNWYAKKKNKVKDWRNRNRGWAYRSVIPKLRTNGKDDLETLKGMTYGKASRHAQRMMDEYLNED
jgi:hypothetical protein